MILDYRLQTMISSTFFTILLNCLMALPLFVNNRPPAEDFVIKTSSSSSNEIWFVPEDPVYRFRRGFPGQHYEALLQHTEQWEKGLAEISVFGIARQMIELGKDDLLIQVGEFSRKYNKAIDIEIPINTYGPNGCGLNPYIESYANKGDVTKYLLRLKKDGVLVSYITMDEPLWFGHFFNGRLTACKEPLEVMVKRVAENVRAALEIFPNAKIGEVEPFTGTREDFDSTLAEWLEVYRRELGFYPKYLHADVIWSSALAARQLKNAESNARSKGIRFGVIYDGDGADRDQLEFANKSVARARNSEAEISTKPDAIIMSWMFEPEALLPESSCSSATGILLRYVNWRRGEKLESCAH